MRTIFLVFLCFFSTFAMFQKKAVSQEGILIDAVHAVDHSDIGLGKENYDYHETCGFRFGFEFLRSQGVRCDRHESGLLDQEKLSRYRLLFINLVSAERPPFFVSEINAIVDFVQSGGSLLIVTDHSNCYFHAHRLAPLLAELGMESPTDTACERPPKTLSSGNGWILVDHFTPHPITRDIEHIAMQTSGRVDPNGAVAWTSEDSWADHWENPPYCGGKTVGYFGNFKQDADESSGPLGVVLAKELGKGKIVVVADQNMFSDPFINYADNSQLWLNSMAWLLDRDDLRDFHSYQQPKSPRLFFAERFEHPAFGSRDCGGLNNLFVFTSRHFWTFANDRNLIPADLAVLAGGLYPLEQKTADDLANHLRAGKNLLVLQSGIEVLELPENGVQQILDSLHQEMTDLEIQEKDGMKCLKIPEGGSICFTGLERNFDNTTISVPSVSPDSKKRDQELRFLEIIEQAREK